MVRRSFRFGLRLGLLGGVGFAVMKVLQARRDEREQDAALRSTEPWPPITPARTCDGGASSPSPAAAPAAPTPRPEASAPPPPVALRHEKDAPPTGPASDSRKVAATWVDPEGRVCPPSHPIKGKLKSHLFHVPGMFAYDRTIPDRCYASEEAAEGDGLSRARR